MGETAPGVGAVDQVLAERELLEYVPTWPLVEPSSPFIIGFHVDAICAHPEAE